MNALATPAAPSFQLTDDQEKALKALVAFLTNEQEVAFVLEGYSGTGKSTLVRTFLQRLPKILQSIKLINPKVKHYELQLTATTNKAAQTFAQITGQEVITLHSFLGLGVETDYRAKQTRLVQRRAKDHHQKLIIVDEASYIDHQLLTTLFQSIRHSKVIFIGDPAQLTPVKSTGTPVFKAGFPTAKLQQVVRQANGNPIVDLSTKFRETVKSGEFFSFTPDNHHIVYLPNRGEFEQAIENEFLRPNWNYNDSKILAWRNATCVSYNRTINDFKRGNPAFQVGDYAVCNSFYSQGKVSIKTDELVLITAISPAEVVHGIKGRYYTLDCFITAFCPDNFADARKRHAQALKDGDYHIAEMIDTTWIDLRAVYACTINKAQGSTYDRVFIDLDDLKGCRNGEQLARLLYVGVSRARHQVIFTGDLV